MIIKENILLIDNVIYDTEVFCNILSELFKYEIDTVLEYESVIVLYNQNEYAFVLLDHSVPDANKMIEYILNKNPQQQFILLSDSLKCPVHCDFCLENFRFIRLLKPIDVRETFKYITRKVDFICPNKHVFLNLHTLEQLNELINLQENSCYIKKEILNGKLVIQPNELKNINMYEIEKIKDLVNEDFFTLNIVSDGLIEITSKEKYGIL
jgi:hypothetical protein